MQTRTLEEVRHDVESGYATIKPFNPMLTSDRFREDVFIPLLEKETERDAIASENETIAAQIKSDRAAAEARRLRLDDRTIGLFSFQTVINCWARFLDSRYSAARLNLVDPIDSLEPFEAVVVAVENALESLRAQFDPSGLDGVRSQVLDEGLALEALLQSNSARRPSIACRRVAAERRLAWLPREPSMAIEFPPAVPISEIDSSECGGLELEIAQTSHDRIKARQKRLNEFEIETRFVEEGFRGSCREEIENSFVQGEKVGSLGEYFHRRTELEAAIVPTEEKITELRLKLWGITEADTPERCALLVNGGTKMRTREYERESHELQDKIADLKQEARRKARLFTQQRKGLTGAWEKYQKGETARHAKELEVLRLEHQARELEFHLNLKLKEVQSSLGHVPPEETFVDSVRWNPRIDETNTVVSIVAVDRSCD
jgi:hypothetical protein